MVTLRILIHSILVFWDVIIRSLIVLIDDGFVRFVVEGVDPILEVVHGVQWAIESVLHGVAKVTYSVLHGIHGVTETFLQILKRSVWLNESLTIWVVQVPFFAPHRLIVAIKVLPHVIILSDSLHLTVLVSTSHR